jgi:hypothetical protein
MLELTNFEVNDHVYLLTRQTKEKNSQEFSLARIVSINENHLGISSKVMVNDNHKAFEWPTGKSEPMFYAIKREDVKRIRKIIPL